MKNTKETILNTALELFNTNGLSKVTLRTIANTMGISQGNLNYHFKKRDDIIDELYFQLVGQIDENMLKSQSRAAGLQSLLNLPPTIMESFYDYRFFMLDCVQVMRENKKIKTHYFQLMKKREMQFLSILEPLIDDQLLRKEILPNEYGFLYKRLQILGEFWIPSAEVSHSRLSKNVILEYSTIISQAIFPYLTNKGKKEYHKIVIAG